MIVSTGTSCFKPIQPDRLFKGKEISYQEHTPSTNLRAHIHCYWELKSLQRLLEPFVYYVVSDGCIDIFFDVNNPCAIDIMGLSNSYHTFTLPHHFHYMGIRFLPGTFASLFKLDVSELTGACLPLNEVNRKLYQQLNETILRSSYVSGTRFNRLIHPFVMALDALFTRIITDHPPQTDFRFSLALDQMLSDKGSTAIEQLQVPVSPRHLRRLFKFYVGESPKAFSKIVRFQNLLNLQPTKETLKREKFFYDLGYYDQAHFIKEFKTIYGLTPNIAFK
ncbi:helix-turn-helix domain-containing protein [Olivibacter sp. XZL3]|uniref:AraC family transcriptional regulator n=1 Tax=Olivibacter sp. XZL3 TaxID=1735116 RepID=UPI0010659A97|nr:helix-turn-helix domain-containing protein [Olivibacter sp. XZL3]